MLFDPIWSVYEPSKFEMIGRVHALLRHEQREPDAGPASDAARDGFPITVDGGIAVVPLIGGMIRRAGRFAQFFGLAGTDATRMAIESAIADDEVQQILIRVDSPGGSVSGIDQLANTIATSTKPITAIVEGMAASAAYFAISGADRIIMGGSDLVGSIGVRIMLYDYSQYFAKEGIEAVPIDTGEFKSAGAMGTKITDAQRADFQRIVDFYFDDFIKAIVDGRKIEEDIVKTFADGRVFTRTEAIELGLVDGVGTYREVLSDLRSKISRRTDSSRARLRI